MNLFARLKKAEEALMPAPAGDVWANFALGQHRMAAARAEGRDPDPRDVEAVAAIWPAMGLCAEDFEGL